MTSELILLFLVILLPIFALTMFIPYWTRKTESFGVSIPDEIFQTPQLKAMRKKYAFITGFIAVISTITFIWLATATANDEKAISLLFSSVIFSYIALGFLVYLQFHRRMKLIKEKERWGEEKSQQIFVSVNFRNQKLTYSNLWFLLPFAMTLVALVLTFQMYQQIPEQIPLKYSLTGEVTNWAEKSYRSVLLLPIMQVYLILLFVAVNTIIAKAKQQIDADRPEASMQKNIIFRRRWSAYIIITAILLNVVFLLTQLSYIYSINNQILTSVPLVLTLVMIIGAVVLSITTGQGGSRIKGQLTSVADGTIINRDDDIHWKLGIFYFNKKDPTLFLEKRFGIGWTINFARPIAWIMILVIIGSAFGIPYLLGL